MANWQVTKSSEANDDLLAVWSYIAKDSEAAATRMLRRIDSAIDTLAYAPYRGELQPQFGDDIRRIIVGNYLVFYQVTDEVRILGSTTPWEDLL